MGTTAPSRRRGICLSMVAVLLVVDFAVEARQGDKVARLVGAGECEDCEGFEGLHVAVVCENGKEEYEPEAMGEFTKDGKFNLGLPTALVKEDGSGLKRKCFTQLFGTSKDAPCPTQQHPDHFRLVRSSKVDNSVGRVFRTATEKLTFSRAACDANFKFLFRHHRIFGFPRFHLRRKRFPKFPFAEISDVDKSTDAVFCTSSGRVSLSSVGCDSKIKLFWLHPFFKLSHHHHPWKKLLLKFPYRLLCQIRPINIPHSPAVPTLPAPVTNPSPGSRSDSGSHTPTPGSRSDSGSHTPTPGSRSDSGSHTPTAPSPRTGPSSSPPTARTSPRSRPAPTTPTYTPRTPSPKPPADSAKAPVPKPPADSTKAPAPKAPSPKPPAPMPPTCSPQAPAPKAPSPKPPAPMPPTCSPQAPADSTQAPAPKPPADSTKAPAPKPPADSTKAPAPKPPADSAKAPAPKPPTPMPPTCSPQAPASKPPADSAKAPATKPPTYSPRAPTPKPPSLPTDSPKTPDPKATTPKPPTYSPKEPTSKIPPYSRPGTAARHAGTE